MRVKRRAIVLTWGLSLLATLWLGAWAFDYETEGAAVGPRGAQPDGLANPPALGEGPQAAPQGEGEPQGFGFYVVWFLAAAASGTLLVSMILFRVEVRREKDRARDRENYRRDQREYHARLRGRNNENT